MLRVPSTDWIWPTHIMEGNLLYSKASILHVNLTQNTLGVTARIRPDQTSEPCANTCSHRRHGPALGRSCTQPRLPLSPLPGRHCPHSASR